MIRGLEDFFIISTGESHATYVLADVDWKLKLPEGLDHPSPQKGPSAERNAVSRKTKWVITRLIRKDR